MSNHFVVVKDNKAVKLVETTAEHYFDDGGSVVSLTELEYNLLRAANCDTDVLVLAAGLAAHKITGETNL